MRTRSVVVGSRAAIVSVAGGPEHCELFRKGQQSDEPIASCISFDHCKELPPFHNGTIATIRVSKGLCPPRPGLNTPSIPTSGKQSAHHQKTPKTSQILKGKSFHVLVHTHSITLPLPHHVPKELDHYTSRRMWTHYLAVLELPDLSLSVSMRESRKAFKLLQLRKVQVRASSLRGVR